MTSSPSHFSDAVLSAFIPRGSFIFFGYKLINTLDMDVFMNECMKVIDPTVEYSYKLAGLQPAA